MDNLFRTKAQKRPNFGRFFIRIVALIRTQKRNTLKQINDMRYTQITPQKGGQQVLKYQGFRGTALYERLSKDDELRGESNSISNQKMYLEDYAKKNGFTGIRHFTDDGYTGTNFNRPGFQAMLAEIESGKIGTVIVKDMSRFGRNYLQVGFYTEMLFPQKDIRFIAINNSVDSARPTDNDFTPFLNIMNEFYAKDTSNKIKAIFNARMQQGKRCSGSVPYGYYRLPEDKQQLYIDPEAGTVVRRIFDLAASGMNLASIAERLTEMKILTPSAYNASKRSEQTQNNVSPDMYRWSPTVIGTILDRREYLGHTVLKKSEQISFKTRKRRIVAPEDRLVFPDTHEPIVDEETWEAAQKYREKTRRIRRSPNGTYANAHVLCGFLYCSECGRRMTVHAHKNKKEGLAVSFRCATYASNRNKCAPNYVSGKNLEYTLLRTLQLISKRVIADETTFAEELKKQYELNAGEVPKRNKAELTTAKKRCNELDGLIRGLYENFVSGMLPERQYSSLMKQYDDEQGELEKKIAKLNEEIAAQQSKPLRIDEFFALIKEFKEPTELTSEMVHALVDKIVVHPPAGEGEDRFQQMEIYFNFVGKIALTLSEEELAEEKARQEKIAAEEATAKLRKRQEYQKKKNQERKNERLEKNEGHRFPKKTCPQCGKEFWSTSPSQVYCSTECHHAADQARIRVKRMAEKGCHTYRRKRCIVCGKFFWPSNGQELMCSEECKVQHRRERNKAYHHKKTSSRGIGKRTKSNENENAATKKNLMRREVTDEGGRRFSPKTCVVCGKEFLPNGAAAKCCSAECANKRRAERDKKRKDRNRENRLIENDGHLYPKRICEFCGKEYWPAQPNQRFCSKGCSHDGAIAERHEGKNPEEKDGHPYFQTNCIVCGKSFWPAGPNVKICSDECRKIRSRQQIKEFHERQKAKKQMPEIISISSTILEEVENVQ